MKQTEDHLHLAFQNSQQHREHLLNSKTEESKQHYKDYEIKNCVLIYYLKTNFLYVNFLQWMALLFQKSLAQGIITIVLLTDIQMINIKTIIVIIIILCTCLYLHIKNINSNVDIIYFGESCCIWSIHLPEHNNAEFFPMTLWKKYLTSTSMYSRMIIV